MVTRGPHIVLVGDDQVIPFRRVWVRPYDGRIDPNWKREREDYYDQNYVPADTTVGAALGRDRTLTDDIYGTARPLPWQADHGLYLPDIPVGRLVETPADMVKAIDLFLQTGGVLTTTSSLVAGYASCRMQPTQWMGFWQAWDWPSGPG